MKIEQYKRLVKERKNCKDCYQFGYCNPSMSKFDIDEIGGFTKWGNDLNAEVLIVGQDFADLDSFIKFQGTVQMSIIQNLNRSKEFDTITNYNLRELSKELKGIELGDPYLGESTNVFFTNAILCLKRGKMNAQINEKTLINCSRKFLKPIIELVNPKVIITLGKHASRGVLNCYKFGQYQLNELINSSLEEMFWKSPIQLRPQLKLYTLYHPSNLGMNNRLKLGNNDGIDRMELMKSDWRKIVI